MKELVSAADLQQCGVSREELLKRFREQLLKDFEMSEMSGRLGEIESLDHDSIHSCILSALKKSNAGQEKQLLYRIDITETQVAKACELSPLEDHAEIVAGLIIKRVLQKVILKLIFSPKK